MRRRFLQFIATFTFRKAWLMLPLIVLATFLAAQRFDRLAIDTSLSPFLPPASAQVPVLRETMGEYRSLEPIMAVIRGGADVSPDELIRVADLFAPRLDDRRFISQVNYRVDEPLQAYYRSLSDLNLIALLTPEDWQELRRQMDARLSADRLRMFRAHRISAFSPMRRHWDPELDPTGALESIRERLEQSRGPTRLNYRNGYFFGPDGRSLVILLYPSLSAANGRFALRVTGFLEKSRDFFFRIHPQWSDRLSIDFIGSHISVARHLRHLWDEISLILLISIPLTLVLFLVVFRKVEAIVFIFVPPLLGITWTLGLAQWLHGGVNVLTAVFLLMVLAMGLHFSSHLYHRFTIELYRAGNYYKALQRSYLDTGRGVLASSIVFCILFLFVPLTSLHEFANWSQFLTMLTQARGFARLGLVAGVGVLFNLAACLVAIPLLASVKHWLARGRVEAVDLYSFHLERIYAPAIANPRAAVGVMLLLSVYLGFQTVRLDFHPNFAAISPFFFQSDSPAPTPPPEGVERPGRPVVAIVGSNTLEGALQLNDRLYENLRREAKAYDILSCDSLRTILPSRRSQSASLQQLAALDVETYRKRLNKISRSLGFRAEAFDSSLEGLRFLQTSAVQTQPITYGPEASDNFTAAVQRYLTRGESGEYCIATAIYPHDTGFDPRRVPGLIRALSQGLGRDVTFMGDPLTERRFARLVRYNLAVLSLLSAFTIILALVLHFRGLRLALLTFLPVMIQVIWLVGAMSLMGRRIHFFTILVIPLALSLAMENVLQITQYFRDCRPCSVQDVMDAIGRVLVLNCGLTALLFGTLGLVSFPGLRDFGVVVVLASGVTLLGTALLLPAMLELYGSGQSLLGPLSLDSDNE